MKIMKAAAAAALFVDSLRWHIRSSNVDVNVTYPSMAIVPWGGDLDIVLLQIVSKRNSKL